MPHLKSLSKGCGDLWQGVVLIGHSTGCQDAVRYVARHRDAADAARLLGVILQAPVGGTALCSAVVCSW